MKKITSLLLCIALVFTACFTLIACSDKASASYVSLDINPSIELTVDEQNKVLSIYAANDDARIMLYEESGIVGEDVEKAIEKITNIAIALGYLDENNKVVGTSVSSASAEWAKKLQEKINTKISVTAKNAGFDVITNAEGAYSLLRKFEELKAKFPNNTAIQNLSVSKFKLALSASENGEISLESAVELDEESLIALVSNTHKQIETFATDAYKKAKAEALSIYDNAMGAIVDGVYGEVYIQNVLSHPTTFWYGHAYQAYKTTARFLDSFADALVFVEKIENKELDEEQITSVLNALCLDASERSKIEQDGKVTIESVYAYADKTFKNTPVSNELQSMKADLDLALKVVEEKAREEISKVVNEYKDDVQNAVETAKSVLDTVTGLMPATIKTLFENQIAEYNTAVGELINVFETGKASQDKMREYANRLNTLAEDMLAKIKADLSESELATVEQKINARQTVIDGYRTTMEQTILDVEQSVKAEIAKRKAERQSNN